MGGAPDWSAIGGKPGEVVGYGALQQGGRRARPTADTRRSGPDRYVAELGQPTSRDRSVTMVRTAETYDRFEKPLANLLDVLQADLLHRRMDTETLRQERNEILRSWPRTRPPQTTSVAQRLPACDFLDVTKAAAAHAPTHHIVAALAPVLDLLHWSYSYPVHPKWPELAAHVAFAEIIGSRGWPTAMGSIWA